jgi:glycosyltransferase involved in cell wall biosynthesis
MSRLLVIAADRVSTWVGKGEVVDRYFNPGAVFDEVHLLLLAPGDDPPQGALQRMVGTATLHVHRMPLPCRPFLRTLGWRPTLVRRMVRDAVARAEEVAPDLVRCHGADVNAMVAQELKARRDIPYAVSLHINPIEDLARSESWRLRLSVRLAQRMAALTLRDADLVLPVYRSIVPYLETLGVRRFDVAYNMLNAKNLRQKATYSLHTPARLISVGRQFELKNPIAVIHALATIPGAELTLVGDGPIHETLVEQAENAGVGARVRFLRSVPNDELCAMLADSDLFVTHSEYWEISKAMLEAFLTGLPVVLNRRKGRPVPELNEDLCLPVENTPHEYATAIDSLLADEQARRRLGSSAQAEAARRWAPEVAERRFADLYRSVLASSKPEG